MANTSKLLYFVGKGGVGKSTLSVLTALQSSLTGHSTLLVSLDPAHNLADIMKIKLKSQPVRVHDNLEALEVNLDDWMQHYLNGIEKQLQSSYRYLTSLNLDKQFASIKLAPGMEEYAMLMAMQNILDKARDTEYIIVDMPPTGLALRFFNLPRLSILWLQKLFDLRKQILQKKEIIRKVRVGRFEWHKDKLSAQLEKQLQRYEGIEKRWKEDATSIKIVLNDDELSLKEAQRIVDQLNEIGMNNYSIIVNKCEKDNRAVICETLKSEKCHIVPSASYPLSGLQNLQQFLQKSELLT